MLRSKIGPKGHRVRGGRQNFCLKLVDLETKKGDILTLLQNPDYNQKAL